MNRPHIKDIFQSIAAKVGTGEPCCDWVSAKIVIINHLTVPNLLGYRI